MSGCGTNGCGKLKQWERRDRVIYENGVPISVEHWEVVPDTCEACSPQEDCRTPPPDTCESSLAICRQDRDAARRERDELRRENKELKQERNCLRGKLEKCRPCGGKHHDGKNDLGITEADEQRISAANSKAKREDVINALWVHITEGKQEAKPAASRPTPLELAQADEIKRLRANCNGFFDAAQGAGRQCEQLRRENAELAERNTAINEMLAKAEQESDKLKDQLAATKDVIEAAHEWEDGWSNPRCNGQDYYKLARKLQSAVNAHAIAKPPQGGHT